MEEPTKNAGQIVNESINNAFKSVKSSTTIQHNYMNNKLI